MRLCFNQVFSIILLIVCSVTAIVSAVRILFCYFSNKTLTNVFFFTLERNRL